MKKWTIAALVTATLCLAVNSALALNKFPPGPGGTCTDTMTIVGLKTLLNTLDPCAPTTPNTTGSPGDTVLGVGGIITGFDENPTGFDIYVEMSGGGPTGKLAGIDVFTHGTNFRAPYGFNRGDSIVVEYAVVANYFGDVELESPNNNFSSPNIILSKRSSGNPMPPFFHGNTTDFVETPTNTVIAPYMSSLVTLDGPVRVARTAGLATGGMLVVRDAAPSDSVFIDYAKLTSIVPPAVGTVLTSISGIVNSAARGWRIMPRDANDVVDVVAPGVADAYAIADNQYRVVFDRPVVPSSADSIPNYSLGSFGTVTSAVMDGPTAVILTVTGTGLSHGQSETVTVSNVRGSANLVSMTTPVPISFLAGVLSCNEISSPDPDSLAASPCQDRSKYCGPLGQFTNGQFGPRSSISGIVCGVFGNLYYLEDDNPSNARGVTVFAPPQALTLGHRYLLAGAAELYYMEKEFAAITYVQEQGNPGVPSPPSMLVHTVARDTCDANQNLNDGYDYMSDLVRLQNVTVVTPRTGTDAMRGFDVVGQSPANGDTIMVESQNNALGGYSLSNPNYPAVGSQINVTGVMHYTTSGFGRSQACFRICPRSAADITNPSTAVGPQSFGELSFAVFPNPAHTQHLNFSLPTAAHVDLAVFDLLGRRVATIVNGQMPAGTYEKSWAGTDDSGNRVRAGVYFYRLRAGNDQRKLTSILLGN